MSAPQTATFRWTHAPQGRRESSQGWSEAEPLVKLAVDAVGTLIGCPNREPTSEEVGHPEEVGRPTHEIHS
ncbi:MAG TPA: hypothetical protein PLS82_15960, partial [Phycisphaerae bacterium]|nr:hypothetical protein [Phycisphaerae bacterium]